MKIYTVHCRRHGLNPDRDIVLVREGFSWAACVFSALWALWHRLWLIAAALFGVTLVMNAITHLFVADDATAMVLGAGVAILTGLFANDLRRWALERQGFADMGPVTGTSEDQAYARFLDQNPDLARGFA